MVAETLEMDHLWIVPHALSFARKGIFCQTLRVSERFYDSMSKFTHSAGPSFWNTTKATSPIHIHPISISVYEKKTMTPPSWKLLTLCMHAVTSSRVLNCSSKERPKTSDQEIEVTSPHHLPPSPSLPHHSRYSIGLARYTLLDPRKVYSLRYWVMNLTAISPFDLLHDCIWTLTDRVYFKRGLDLY